MFKRLSTIGLVAVAAVSFSSMAFAADSSGNANDADQGSAQTQQLIKGYRSDAQQLEQIHDATIKHDPKLAQEQSHFESMVKSAIHKQGYDVDSGQKRMEQYAKELQDGKLSDAKRKDVMQKFENEREKMIKARDAALSQPAIEKAGRKLQKDTIEAMNKQNSKTNNLIADMKAKRAQLQKSMVSHDNGSNTNGK